MLVMKAMKAYKQENPSCVQSRILRGVQEQFKLAKEQIVAARQSGDGHAENGCCGALYAATMLLRDAKAKESIRQRFVAATGSDKCKEIRKQGRLSCSECAELSANLSAEKFAIQCGKSDTSSLSDWDFFIVSQIR